MHLTCCASSIVQCRRPVEKSAGCMHMTCTAGCKHEWCWLCCGAWSTHGQQTGGFYACNAYEAARLSGLADEATMRAEAAKASLERFHHFYERHSMVRRNQGRHLWSPPVVMHVTLHTNESNSLPLCAACGRAAALDGGPGRSTSRRPAGCGAHLRGAVVPACSSRLRRRSAVEPHYLSARTEEHILLRIPPLRAASASHRSLRVRAGRGGATS